LIVVEGASRLDNDADEENPLVIRRKAPHNQRIEQTPFGRSSSASLGVNQTLSEEESIMAKKKTKSSAVRDPRENLARNHRMPSYVSSERR